MRSDSPRDTATLVVRSILVAAKDERLSTLVAEGEEEVLEAILGSRGQPLWLTIAIERRRARALLLRFERWMRPGIIAHYLVRKRPPQEPSASSLTSPFRWEGPFF
jgi:hypothetical protein